MKKRFGIISMIVVLLVCFAVCFTACGSKNGGGEDNGNAIDISNDYNYAQIEQKVNELAGTDGMYVKIHVTESDTDGGDEDFYIAMGVKGDVYYYLSKVSESYFDLRSETQCDEYSKEDNVWTKDIYYYGTYYTQAQMKQLMAGQSAGVMGWFGYYRAVQAGEGTKTTTTFLNRSCDKYTVSMNYYGAVYNQEVIIDKTTGICLKYSASASYGGEGGGLTIECTEFNTSWNYTLPQVTAANTETHGTPSGGGQGGGSGEGGQGGQGGSGEGGQGGQGGQGGSGEGGDNDPFVGKRFTVSSVNIEQNHNLESLFENAYAQLYNDNNFELISDAGCMLGNYLVVFNTAYLNTIKIYNDDKYDYETPENMDELQLVYDESDDAYSLSFEISVDDQNVTVEMVVEAAGPISAHDNIVCPLDPNGYGYDPVYQVTAEIWYGIFKGDYLFEDIGNFTVNYSVSSQTWPRSGKFEVDYDVFNDDDLMIHERESWTPDQDGQYDFHEYYSNGNAGWNDMGTAYFDLVDHWDTYTGAIPAEFIKAGYNSISHNYYINSFKYTPRGESEITITNFGVWFNNSLPIKVQYTKNGETFTYNYSEYGTTEVEVPNML